MSVSQERDGINIFTECPGDHLLSIMVSLGRITLSESLTVAGWTFTSLTFHVILN